MKFPVMPADAATTLDADQQAWMLERYGERYVGVQGNADVMSRKERRRRGDRGHNFGLGSKAIPGGKR